MRIQALLFASVLTCWGQTAIDTYMRNGDVQDVIVKTPADRTEVELRNILPRRLSQQFAEYAGATSRPVSFETLRAEVERLRLNKTVGNTPGGSGTTSLVSRVAVPGLLGFATEYGAIVQSSSGNTTTLRGNLLGIGRLAFGAEQFPNCAEIDQKNCQTSSRWLRRFSGVLSFEDLRTAVTTGQAMTATKPVTADLFGNDFRMGSWGARFDVTANDPDDPKFVEAWKGAMTSLRGTQAPADLAEAVANVLTLDTPAFDAYVMWENETIRILQVADTATAAGFRTRLEERLKLLITVMAQVDTGFAARVALLRNAFVNYSSVRDDLIREIQRHRVSVEYTNQHPQNQPTVSNLRVIYSHQPTKSPTLITANAAFTWYNATPSLGTGRFRDFQLAGQLDRRLGEIPSLGNAVATFAAYYQWMKEDALIVIGPGSVAPGSGIVLPGTAAALLNTKGNIAVVQGKVSIPVNATVKVPISITWSNRTELIHEKDIRGQVGITLDVDSLFK